MCPDEVIQSDYFDLVCTGEGEDVFAEILTRLETNKSLERIPNTNNNPKAPLIPEDRLWCIEPDYSIFPDEYFNQPGFEAKMMKRCKIESARGCPYNCTYCANETLQNIYKGLGKFVRLRPLEFLKREIKRLNDTYNIEMFTFKDECFLIHKDDWLKEFADWYGKEIKKPFAINTRAETVTEEKVQMLKTMAPMFQMGIGVESGSERILKVLGRKVTVGKIIETFDLLNKHGIRTQSPFMIGLPYETREDIFKSIELARRIKSTIASVNIYQPMPGQRLREICIEEDFLKETDRMHRYSDRSVLKMPQIAAEEIKNISRVFSLYVKLPKEYYPQIEMCEKDFFANKKLHAKLLDLKWSLE